MNLIVIAGMPATGKSTIANQIRDIFGYPVFEKDYLKEALFDIIGFECYAEKRRHDKAATEILLRIVESQLQAGKKLRIVFPNTKVIAFLPIWGNDPRLYARNLIRCFNNQDVNRELANIYSKYNVEVARDNFFPQINDFYSSDLVHPNDLGDILIGDELLTVLINNHPL